MNSTQATHRETSFERFAPEMTVPGPDEERVARELDETMGKIRQTTFENSGHAIRSVHAKSHGLLEAELEIPEGLPPELAQGLFARPGRHAVVMRFSTNPGDILPDSVSTPRGLAIKVLDVEGVRLPGDSEAHSQDFVMVNGPVFTAPTGEKFLANLKLLAATTDRVEGLKKALSATLRGVETVIEAVGGESGTLKQLGGHPQTHILGETFFTQLPIRYGDYIAKFQVAPVSPGLTTLTDTKLEHTDDPDALRRAVREFFERDGGEWEVRVQLCTNLENMPLEPANAEWDEEESPFVTVGRLRAKRQDAWNEKRAEAVDDAMGFSPWHGVDSHWPLGSMMRLRQRAYRSSQEFRSERNRCPVHEPAEATLP